VKQEGPRVTVGIPLLQEGEDVNQPDLDKGTQVFALDRGGFEQWGKAYLIACALASRWADHEDYSHKWERATCR
jgi:hypothetical protein